MKHSEFNWLKVIKESKVMPISMIPLEDAWDSSTLEEMFERHTLTEAALTSTKISDITPGDIVLVSSFVDETQNSTIGNKEHLILVVADTGENSINNRTFFGYRLTSKIEKTNKYSDKYTSDIYIDDFDTIVTPGSEPSNHRRAGIILGYFCSFTPDDFVKRIGRAKPEFLSFIKDTLAKKRQNQDTSNIYWEV